MENEESASFVATASPGGAVNGMASSGLPSAALFSEPSAKFLAISVPSLMRSSLLMLPWYFWEIALSFSTFSGETSAESDPDESQRDTMAMQIQIYTSTLAQRGSRLKSTQAERSAHPATSNQNRIRCPGSSRGNSGFCSRSAAGLVFLCRLNAGRGGRGSLMLPEATRRQSDSSAGFGCPPGTFSHCTVRNFSGTLAIV